MKMLLRSGIILWCLTAGPFLEADIGPLPIEGPIGESVPPTSLHDGPQEVTMDVQPTQQEALIDALNRFEAQHGHRLDPELRQRLEAYWRLYHGSTLETAQAIITADGIDPEERMYELDAYLRSRDGEWTPGAVGQYLGGKVLDTLKDKAITAAITAYAPYLAIPVQMIMGANNVVSFLPGFSVGYGDDLVAYLEKEGSTDRHRQVHEFLKECRGLTSDQIKARMAEHDRRSVAITQRIKTIPEELRRNVIADIPPSLYRLAPGMTADLWWAYVEGTLPQPYSLQIDTFLAGQNPQFDGWVRACQAHFRQARAETLTLIREQILLHHLNQTAELRLRMAILPDHSVFILIDASGSMDGEKIANAIATASGQIQRLGPDTELAVRSFSGNSVNFPFTVMMPDAQAHARAAVNGITSGGGTPLAANIRSAGEYIRRNARGKQITLIILSDGEETAGGDPPAEVARLNDINVSW